MITLATGFRLTNDCNPDSELDMPIPYGSEVNGFGLITSGGAIEDFTIDNPYQEGMTPSESLRRVWYTLIQAGYLSLGEEGWCIEMFVRVPDHKVRNKRQRFQIRVYSMLAPS